MLHNADLKRFFICENLRYKVSALSACHKDLFNFKINIIMKKTLLTLSLIVFAFCSYAQNEAKPKTDETPSSSAISGFLKDYLGNDHNMLRSPITKDYLKNYQEKNTINKFSLPSVGMNDVKKSAQELENIDNLIVVKPNLVELIKMPTIRPDGNTQHTMRIVNSDTNKSKPLE